MPQQQQPQSKMPYQAYANYAMWPWVSLLFWTLDSCQSIMLDIGVCYSVSFSFQVPTWLPCSPVGAQPLVYSPLQCFGVSTQQAHVLPDDGLWPTPGVHQMAAPSTALSSGASCYSLCCTQAIPCIWWGIQLWGLDRIISFLQPSCIVGRGLLFQVLFHLMTQ